MPSKFWIKLYHEVLHDPKMGMLPDNLWRRAIELFLLAGEVDMEGGLPPLIEIAWSLRLPLEALEAELEELSKVNIVTKTENGEWFVTNFKKRQNKVPDADKQREYRKRKREGKVKAQEPKSEPPDLNGKGPEGEQEKVIDNNEMSIRNVTDGVTDSVTCRNTDIDIDTDKDITTKVVSDKPLPPPPRPSKKVKPKKSRASPKPKDGAKPKTELRDTFLELTHLTWPKQKSQQGFWWGQFGELLNIGENANRTNWPQDSPVERTKAIIADVVSYMNNPDDGKKKLTISSPKSLVNLARTSANEPFSQKGTNNNGSNKTTIAGLKTTNADRPVKKRFNPKTGETYYVDTRTQERVQSPGVMS